MIGGSVETELRRLVDEYRATCLWCLREDYYPETPPEREQVLTLTAQHGDLRAFRRVAEFRSGGVDTLEQALRDGDLRFHKGRIGGAWPRVKG